MKNGWIVGVMVAILGLSGCAAENAEKTEGPEKGLEVGLDPEIEKYDGQDPVQKHVPKTVVISIIENPAILVPNPDDPGGDKIPSCIPDPEYVEIWHGDTVIFKNEYPSDVGVMMAPGPLEGVWAKFTVKAGDEEKTSVGSAVKHGHDYRFMLTCDPRGPGPGMRGDDPTRPD